MPPVPTATATPDSAAEGDARGAWYVVAILGAVYALNIADRYVVSVLIEPMKADLRLSDTSVGFLTGIAMAVFYVTAGIPIATLADRANRTRLVAWSLAAWSGFTALCGLTRTFWQLVAARVLVGVGEAGGTAPSTSLISDYFGWRRRALALSLYSTGASLGSMIGSSAGFVSDQWGWRTAFFVLGIPGVILAGVMALTLREPERGRLDVGAIRGAPGASFREVLRFARRSPALLHCYAAGFLYCTWGWGLMWWTPSYLIRSHHMTLSEASGTLALIHGVGGTTVLLLTSVAMKYLTRGDVRSVPRFIAYVCSLGSIPAIIAFTTHDRTVALGALWCFIPVTYAVFGPPYSLIQNLAPANQRAQAMCVLMLVSNIGNLIIAPQLVGIASDALAARFGDESLRMALLPLCGVGVWAAFHWWRAGDHVLSGMERAGTLAPGASRPGESGTAA